MLKQHLFIAYARNVHKFCAVYKTFPNEKIFAVFAKGGIVKRYIEGKGKLTDLYCSHDLNFTTGKQKKHLRSLLRICFRYQYKQILSFILMAAQDYKNRELPDLEERRKTFDPKYSDPIMDKLVMSIIKKKAKKALEK